MTCPWYPESYHPEILFLQWLSVAWLVVPLIWGSCLSGYFNINICFLRLAFTVGLSKIWLPLYSGLPKWASCYLISTNLHSYKDLSSVCTAQFVSLHSSVQCHTYTDAPWPASHAGATAITGILTQSLVTVAVIRILHRWLSKFSPSMGFEHPTYHLGVDNLTTSLGHHTPLLLLYKHYLFIYYLLFY